MSVSLWVHGARLDPGELLWRSDQGRQLWLTGDQLLLKDSAGRLVHAFSGSSYFLEGNVGKGTDLEIRSARLSDGSLVGLLRWNGEFRVVGRNLNFFVGSSRDCLLFQVDDPGHPAARILAGNTLASLRRESNRNEVFRAIESFRTSLKKHEEAAIERAALRTLEFDPLRNPLDQTYRLTSAELLEMADRLQSLNPAQLVRFRLELEKLTTKIELTIPGPEAFETSPIAEFLRLLNRSRCSALESAA